MWMFRAIFEYMLYIFCGFRNFEDKFGHLGIARAGCASCGAARIFRRALPIHRVFTGLYQCCTFLVPVFFSRSLLLTPFFQIPCPRSGVDLSGPSSQFLFSKARLQLTSSTSLDLFLLPAPFIPPAEKPFCHIDVPTAFAACFSIVFQTLQQSSPPLPASLSYAMDPKTIAKSGICL